jgi:hypothetical protein
MWILFAGIGLWFFARSVRLTGTADRVSSVAHGIMGFGMAFGMHLPAWIQVAVFAPMTVWFAGLATVPHRPDGFAAVHHAFMSAGMVVMACVMSLPGHLGHQLPAVLGVYVLGVYFLVATIPFLIRVMRTDALGHAAMTFGAAVLFFGM